MGKSLNQWKHSCKQETLASIRNRKTNILFCLFRIWFGRWYDGAGECECGENRFSRHDKILQRIHLKDITRLTENEEKQNAYQLYTTSALAWNDVEML